MYQYESVNLTIPILTRNYYWSHIIIQFQENNKLPYLQKPDNTGSAEHNLT